MGGSAAFAQTPPASQLPSGGNLVAGQANWQNQGSTLVVNQASQRAVIDWQSFNIGSQAKVIFNQDAGRAAATLNRVVGMQPSQILGSLQAQGQVFVSNPYGVIFGAGATVDVGGLVATSMTMGSADFMNGGGRFERAGATGSVVNAGTLTAAEGGYVALLAPEVRNEGVVSARAGTVALAAGESVRLQFADHSLVGVAVDPAALKTLVENRQALLAEGGTVILSARSADALKSGVVNQGGTIDAGSLVSRGGRIVLEADSITLADGSRTSASGATGGGQVLVGGGWQGSGDMHQALNVTMASGAEIDASATVRGDGGEVVLWSQVANPTSLTTAAGRITARGAGGEAGGRVETSGNRVALNGLAVDAGSTGGAAGSWLLDPLDIVIGAGGNVDSGSLINSLNSGSNVVVASANFAGTGVGHISVTNPLSWNTTNTLQLSAHGNITLAAPITAAQGKLVLEYGLGAVSAGNTAEYRVQAPITLSAGNNFSTRRGSDGSLINHTVITSLGGATSNGDGTLQGMRGNLAGNFVLGADIDAATTAGWNSNTGFTPVGDGSTPFSGNFDGLGHTVSGLTINRPSSSNLGLFGATSGASIRNLGIAGVNIAGTSGIGAIAGSLGSNTLVSSVYATGTISASSGMAGGLSGNMAGGTVVSDSYAGVNVTSPAGWIGGLVGDQGGATLTRVYATGNVSGTGNTGSLIGGKNGAVTDSFASGSVNGYGNALYGYSFSGTLTNSRAVNTNEIKSASTFGGWDFSSTWTIYEGQTTPLLNAFLKPLTVSATGLKTYDRTLLAPSGSLVFSDPAAAALVQGQATYLAPSSNAGTYGGVTMTGLYSGQQGYRISYVAPPTLTIIPAVVNVVGTASSKTYDGGTAAQLQVSLNGALAGDTVGITWGNAAFSDKNVGTGKAVTATFVLDGASAANYVLGGVAPLQGTITPATLTYTGASAAHKVYDAGTSASVGGGTLSGRIGADVVNVSSTGTFADKNVGAGKTVNVSYAVSGADAGNYSFSAPATLLADITPAPLSFTPVIGNKVYDGSTVGSLINGTFNGVFNGDAINVGTHAQFADKNVGSGKTVNLTYTWGGADLGNYVTSAPTTTLASITPATLTYNGIVVASKVYDGGTTATVSGGAIGGRVLGDQVAISTNAQFADKNVGSGKTVSLAHTLSGADAGNYVLTAAGAALADITPATLNVTGVTVAHKVYDATTRADISGGALAGVIGGDVVNLAAGGATFADKNVGNGKAVTANFSIHGAGAGNYVLAQPSGLAANITPATLHINGATATGKVYDGGVGANVANAALAGLLGGDAVTLNAGEARYADANVGTAKSVQALFSLGGADAGNYRLDAATLTLTGDITQRASVSWVGGATGDWFSAANWQDGAVPTLANVANVVIPGGSIVSLTQGDAALMPKLNSVTGTGSLQLGQATLVASGAVALGGLAIGADANLQAGSVDVANWSQSGGQVRVNGALDVRNAFEQSAGTLRVDRGAKIVQATGTLALQHLVANGVTLQAAAGDIAFQNIGSTGDVALTASGNVTEGANGSVTALGNFNVQAGGDVALQGERNLFVGSMSAQGRNVAVTQGMQDLMLGDVGAAGDLQLKATRGNILQLVNTTVAVGGNTQFTAPQGGVQLSNATNLFLGAVGGTAATDVLLKQSTGPLTLATLGVDGNLTLTSAGAVNQTGALIVAGKTWIEAGDNTVTLNNAGNDFVGSVTLRGGQTTLIDSQGGLLLGALITNGATLVNSMNGPLTMQSGAKFVAMATSVLPVFNAWLDGAYTTAQVASDSSVMLNGQLTGGATASPAASIAGALASTSAPALATPATTRPGSVGEPVKDPNE